METRHPSPPRAGPSATGRWSGWPRRPRRRPSTHPNWAMGQRITIDSASMFNKAMEVIEAREFFGLAPRPDQGARPPANRIIHALVGFRDGGDHGASGRARHAPRHRLCAELARAARRCRCRRLDLAAAWRLTFRAPDEQRWPALRLAREVMAAGGAAGAVFNAAKEQALDDFITGRIGFIDMAPRGGGDTRGAVARSPRFRPSSGDAGRRARLGCALPVRKAAA